jgi:hypothetical protein
MAFGGAGDRGIQRVQGAVRPGYGSGWLAPDASRRRAPRTHPAPTGRHPHLSLLTS